MFYKWLMDDAKWYEFWMPQSGPIGGLISAVIVFGPFIVWKYL